jgi:hypothetical protein
MSEENYVVELEQVCWRVCLCVDTRACVRKGKRRNTHAALTLACSPTPDSTCNVVQCKVRAALLVDPNNADLIKLEADLKDIIALSSELEEKPSKIDWKVVSVLARTDRRTDRQQTVLVVPTRSPSDCPTP